VRPHLRRTGIALRIDGERPGDELQRLRERGLQQNANLVAIELFGVVDPHHVARIHHLVGRIDRPVQRMHHIVGVEVGAIVELHALAQIELHGLRIHPAPRGGEARLVFQRDRVTLHQPVPQQVRHHHHLAYRREVDIEGGCLIVPDHLERVGGLAGLRHRGGKRGQRQAASRQHSFHAHACFPFGLRVASAAGPSSRDPPIYGDTIARKWKALVH